MKVMAKQHPEADWNRYEHVIGLTNKLLASGEARLGFMGIPQGQINLQELITAVLAECEMVGIGRVGAGHVALEGLRKINNMPGFGLFGRSVGGLLSLHDFEVPRRLFTSDVPGALAEGIENTRVLAVDYHARGKIGSTDVSSFVGTLIRVQGFDQQNSSPISTVTVIPRNQYVATAGICVLDDPLGHVTEVLEGITASRAS